MTDLPLSSEGAVIPGLVHHLSASSVGLYLKCPRRWWYQYVVGVKPKSDGGLIVGRAFHSSVEVALQAKIDGKKVTVDSMRELVTEGVRLVANDEGFPVDERGPYIDKANRLITAWTEKVYPTVKPLRIEVPWVMHFADVKVIGRFDLLEVGKRIRDWKTSGKSPVEDAAFSTVQTELYLAASETLDEPIDEISYTYLVDQPKSGVKVVERTVSRPREVKALKSFAEETVRDVAKGIRAGVFPRRRDGWHCDPKWCPFWDMCIVDPRGPRPD